MNNWQTEYKNAIKNVSELEAFLGLQLPQLDYPIFLPRNFLLKIKNAGVNSPLYKQFIPDINESIQSGLVDPIGDQRFLVTKNLIHRYRNRALFIPTTNCPVICRYCFRKNELNNPDVFGNDLASTIDYLTHHPEINELIFTGGDPFILSDEKLYQYSSQFSKIKSIKFLRFHTRTPIILPERIDNDFLMTMKKIKEIFTQVNIMIHVNHVDEIDLKVEESLSKLKTIGVNIFSQTVLLKGVNDKNSSLINLFSKLGEIGIIPYYLHHPDSAMGTKHFQLKLEEGRKIYRSLQNDLPGWLIPKYIYDIPKGEGKISAFNPESDHFGGTLISMSGTEIKIEEEIK